MKSRTLLWSVLLLAVTSCGYQFSGTGAVVDPAARKLAVPVFFNQTSEPYLDVDVTQAVIEEFMTDGRLRIVGLEEADIALYGKIVKFEAVPLSYKTVPTGETYVQQYRVALVVDAYLQDVRSKKVIWQQQNVQSNFIADYAVALGDIRGTRVSKDAAIKKAGQDIAWTLRSGLLEGF